MATTTFRNLVSYVQPQVKNCPVTTIVQAIRDSFIELCRRGYIWTEDYNLTITADQKEQDVSIPSDTRIVGVVWLKEDEDDLVGLIQDEDFTFNDTQIILDEEADVSDTWYLRVALAPTDAATGMDSDLATRWRRAVVHGALADLMAMAGAWFNADLSRFNRIKFDSEIGRAQAEYHNSKDARRQRLDFGDRGHL